MRFRLKKRWIILIGLAVFALLLLRSRATGPAVADGSYLLLQLRGDYTEGRPPGFLARFLEDRERLLDVLGNLEKARHDDRIAGVIARIGSLETGWAQATEIRNSLRETREAGKKVVAFLDGETFGGNKEYYVASAAEEIYLPPASSALLNGLSAHYVFLGGFWEKIDVAMEVQQIREYKTFGDMLQRRSMSKAHREMPNSLLDDLDAEFRSAIGESRGLTPEEVAEIIESCPASPEAFVGAGLADGVKFLDQVTKELGKGSSVELIEGDRYAAVSRESIGIVDSGKVALIHASGVLVSGKGGRSGSMGDLVGSARLAEALRAAADDDATSAIVLRIDSPGGSPHAADEVWHAVRRAARDKPVVASLGNVAASGGYYIATGADAIVTGPTTLTGSIGVVVYKPNVSGLLGRLGVGSESLARGRYSLIMDVTKGLDRAELALLGAQMDSIYRLFTERVAEGRQMTIEAVDSVGGGRVWTGHQAVSNQLADQMGGLRNALRLAAIKGGIKNPDRVGIVHYPEPESLSEQLLGLGLVRARALVPQVLEEALGGFVDYLELASGPYLLMAPGVSIR